MHKASSPAELPGDELAVPALTAARAALVYVSDGEPGIRRRRQGKGFRYFAPDGKPVRDERVLERIRALAVPPAWTDVWISAEPEGHIQATGRDQRGRKQYRYHPRWTAFRDEVKYSGLIDFAHALPRLRERMNQDLRRRGLSRERVIASIIWLLDHTMIRVGNHIYARDNKSFGLTTLKARHVEVEGSRLRFAFKGKSGKEWQIRLVDRRMARIIRSVQDLPGQHLFQYLDDEGKRHLVHSQDVNDYIRAAAGADFSSKHFRTWGGTVRALSRFAEVPLPETKSAATKTMNAVIDEVARNLGNTRAICRRCYIHPEVLETWQAGRLHDDLQAVRSARRKPVDGLDQQEDFVLKWLEAATRGQPGART